MALQKTVLTASSVTGNDVKNREGESLGTIKEIMLCTRSNEIRYYVLSFGGFLGLGDKLFAIPPEAMQLDVNGEQFILNIPKEKLANSNGFDKDNWPDFADEAYNQKLYTQYGYPYKAPHPAAA